MLRGVRRIFFSDTAVLSRIWNVLGTLSRVFIYSSILTNCELFIILLQSHHSTVINTIILTYTTVQCHECPREWHNVDVESRPVSGFEIFPAYGLELGRGSLFKIWRPRRTQNFRICTPLIGGLIGGSFVLVSSLTNENRALTTGKAWDGDGKLGMGLLW